MFRNYFRIAMRNLFKHKAYSAINITGLAVGQYGWKSAGEAIGKELISGYGGPVQLVLGHRHRYRVSRSLRIERIRH